MTWCNRWWWYLGEYGKELAGSKRLRVPGLVVVILALVALAFLVLNVVVVVCFIHRRVRKRVAGKPH